MVSYGILLDRAAPNLASSVYSNSSPIAIPLAIDEILFAFLAIFKR